VKTLSRVLCLAFAFFALHAWASNVAYKCTSAAGEVSFLDKRPSEGCASIEEVRISSSGEALVDETGNPEGSPETLAEQDKKEIAEREKRAKEDCTKRKAELEALRSRAQIVTTNPVTKEKKVLSPEEHQAKIRQWEDYVKTFCNTAPTTPTPAPAATGASQ
jgi:hypothetical protein